MKWKFRQNFVLYYKIVGSKRGKAHPNPNKLEKCADALIKLTDSSVQQIKTVEKWPNMSLKQYYYITETVRIILNNGKWDPFVAIRSFYSSALVIPEETYYTYRKKYGPKENETNHKNILFLIRHFRSRPSDTRKPPIKAYTGKEWQFLA